MMKIVEISKKIGKSKTAIYNKINKNKALFQPYLKKVENSKALTNEGIELLEKLFNLKEVKNVVENTSLEYANINTLNDVSLVKNIVESKEQLIKELKARIEYLEKQIEKKDTLISNLNRQQENFQVLLQNEQNKTLLLEQNKSGFFKRLFKKF